MFACVIMITHFCLIVSFVITRLCKYSINLFIESKRHAESIQLWLLIMLLDLLHFVNILYLYRFYINICKPLYFDKIHNHVNDCILTSMIVLDVFNCYHLSEVKLTRTSNMGSSCMLFVSMCDMC